MSKSKAIETNVLAKGNKESLSKVSEEIDDIKDMLKKGQKSRKKGRFLRNVIFLAALGIGGITAYGALDDIKKKLKEFGEEKKKFTYLKGQLPSLPKSYEDVKSGVSSRAGRLGGYFDKGTGGRASRIADRSRREIRDFNPLTKSGRRNRSIRSGLRRWGDRAKKRLKTTKEDKNASAFFGGSRSRSRQRRRRSRSRSRSRSRRRSYKQRSRRGYIGRGAGRGAPRQSY